MDEFLKYFSRYLPKIDGDLFENIFESIILDDVVHIGIAMGTPGDKKEISKVVKREIQQPVEQEQPSFPAPTSNLPLQQPVPGNSIIIILNE